MQVDDNLIDHLELLSCLTLSEEEKERLSVDLKKIISGMARLNELDTAGMLEQNPSYCNANVFREDEVRASYPRELILKNAPKRTDDMFIAPKAVD